MDRCCFLVVNPTSGSYSARRIGTVMSRLEAAGFTPRLHLTTCAEDAPRLARQICEQETAPFIVAGGGDGTINGVVNGLLPGKATLGVLPLGTANVLAKELGIHSVNEGVEKIVRQEARAIAVGTLETAGKTTRFLLMAGIGFDGEVVEGVRLAEKRLIGKGAYLLSALRALANWDRSLLPVRIDDREVQCHGAIICKASRYGGNFVLAPDANIFTPEFQVICITDSRFSTYLRLLMGLVSGMQSGAGLSTYIGREVVIGGGKAVQLDGDFHCRGPVQITAAADFLKIII